MFSRLNYRFLLIPPLVFFGLVGLDVFADTSTRQVKAELERMASLVTGGATLAAALRLLLARHPFFVWFLALVALVMCREIHFLGSSEMLMLGLPLLALVAWRKYEVLRVYLEHRVSLSLLFTVLITYAWSQSVDLRWWRGLHHEVALEESMEVLGHTLLLAAVLLARRVGETPAPEGVAEAGAFGGDPRPQPLPAEGGHPAETPMPRPATLEP